MILTLLLAACTTIESECVRMCETRHVACAEVNPLHEALYEPCLTGCATYDDLTVREQETMDEYVECGADWMADVEKYEADGAACADECGIDDFSRQYLSEN
jgi:hypothetical protein